MTTPDRRFPTTIWEDISSARKGSSRELDLLLSRYRAPIVGFLRWKNVNIEEAEDLAQEVLIRVSHPGFLEKVDPAKGRFRSLLLAVTRNVLSEGKRRDHAERRGGGARIVHESDFSDGATPLIEKAPARAWRWWGRATCNSAAPAPSWSTCPPRSSISPNRPRKAAPGSESTTSSEKWGGA